MAGSARFLGAAMILAAAASPAMAADFATPAEPLPPPAPVFYVHAGVLGEFLETNEQLAAGTGRTSFVVTNVAVRPLYTLALEAGYFVTPNVAIALSAGVPPALAHFKATGFTGAGLLGTDLLGSVRGGSIRVLLQYHYTELGAFQPYFGAGVSYFLNFGNISDGILTNFALDQNFSFVVQAGADWMLTPNWGVFVDGKKAFFSTDASGFVLNTATPVRANIRFDPWIASAGVTFKY
jgi:outer membrane protein